MEKRLGKTEENQRKNNKRLDRTKSKVKALANSRRRDAKNITELKKEVKEQGQRLERAEILGRETSAKFSQHLRFVL